MDIDYSFTRFPNPDDVAHWRGKSRVLLREPEVCRECNRVYISLYPLRVCRDHEGLEGI